MTARPRVGIDAHFLERPEGNGSAVRSLLLGLAATGASERFEVIAYAIDPDRARAALGEAAGAFSWRALPRGAVRRYVLGVPSAQRDDRLDLWHATFVAPRGRARLVLAFHDALAFEAPELLPWAVARKLRLLAPGALARAARVLVPTRAVARGLEGRVEAARLAVVPLGVDPRFAPVPGEAPSERVPAAYALAVGRDDPRKDLRGLARAAATARVPLVVAGPHGRPEALRAELEGLGARVTVVAHPDVPALAALYRGASALAYPSRGEGFGLPLVEAMACGTPLVASDLETLREVAGDAALAWVAPGDGAGLAAALARAVALSPEERARLAALGVARARAFSLEAQARGTEAAWRESLV